MSKDGQQSTAHCCLLGGHIRPMQLKTMGWKKEEMKERGITQNPDKQCQVIRGKRHRREDHCSRPVVLNP